MLHAVDDGKSQLINSKSLRSARCASSTHLPGYRYHTGTLARGLLLSPRASTFEFCNESPARTEMVNVGIAGGVVGEDGWAQLAPFGNFPGEVTKVWPDGRVEGPKAAVQRMDRQAAEAMVAAFKRPWSRVMRWAKGLPIFHGHPDQPGAGHRYPDSTQKGVIADLEIRDTGLYARPLFNNEGQSLLEKQPGLAFSARWSAEEVGETNGVVIFRPSELLSAGLTTNPNLPVTAINEAPPMDLKALIAALKKLGITTADDADLAAATAAVEAAAAAKATADAEMANERSALATARTALTSAEGTVATLRTEIANERTERARLLIDGAIREGRITEADRPRFVTAFANDFAAGAVQLAAAKTGTLKTTPTAHVKGAVESTATIADRQRVVTQLINERMAKGDTYNKAFADLRESRKDLFGEQAK